MHASSIDWETVVSIGILVLLAVGGLVAAFWLVDTRERKVASKRTLPFRSLETLGAVEVEEDTAYDVVHEEKTSRVKAVGSQPPDAA